jgi:hypothetical protein
MNRKQKRRSFKLPGHTPENWLKLLCEHKERLLSALQESKAPIVQSAEPIDHERWSIIDHGRCGPAIEKERFFSQADLALHIHMTSIWWSHNDFSNGSVSVTVTGGAFDFSVGGGTRDTDTRRVTSFTWYRDVIDPTTADKLVAVLGSIAGEGNATEP